MTTEALLIDRLIVEAKARAVAERRLEDAVPRLDMVPRLISERDRAVNDATSLRARNREAGPKLRKLFHAAESYMTEVEARKPTRAREAARIVLRKALHDAFDYCDQIPF